jgi:pimeloyl-ACP methyl ester carboxylesterase
MGHPRQFLEVSGRRLAYAELGSGPPVVLLHGALTGIDDLLLALGDRLADKVRLIAVDRPGYGGSEGDWETASIWNQARLLREMSRKLMLSRPLLVGHSLGGAVATAWALQEPAAVRGVVAVAPLAFPEARLEHLLFGPRATPLFGDAFSFAAMPMDTLVMPAIWRTMFQPQPVPEDFAHAFPTTDPGERRRLRTVGREAARLIPDLSRSAALYGAARARLQILFGDSDRVANPMVHARALAALWPDSRCLALSGVGHMVHHSRPEVVADAVCEMLAAPTSVGMVPA